MNTDKKHGGEPPADQFGHGGNLRELAARTGVDPARILDFSASINPLGPPEYLRMVVSRSLEKLAHYPEPHSEGLRGALSGILAVAPDRLAVANGSTEIIYALPRALGCRRAVIPVPAYSDYEKAARLHGLEVVQPLLAEENGFRPDFAELAAQLRDGDLLYLGRPNNPTGVSFAAEPLLALAAAHPGVYFAVDESFHEFISEESGLISAAMPDNLIVFRSLTKFYAIPGLRLGFVAASPATAALVGRQLLPWTVNTLAQEIGAKAVNDRRYAKRSREYVRAAREELQAGLAAIPGLQVFPGEANYLLVKLENKGGSVARLAEKLLADSARPIAIRDCVNFSGLGRGFFRVAVRSGRDNELLRDSLAAALTGRKRAVIGDRRRKTPALMLQGTSSNAGKSVLTAALGRIFLQDGFRVSPFKAQNMSLNSYVTRDGFEMGRAQVVQAQACRLDPEVRMNPVLLKPSSEGGSQIIVNGKVVGNMTVDNYIDYKPVARAAACAAYDSLAAEYEVILLEGAGSPAEVNLKKHDIVNMGMARHAEASVLLVGDIDRGGVFASFIGTLEVMAEWERRLVAGFLVNRFRGQASLLNDAFDYLLDFTGKPVLGTIPYIRDHGLPEEDSVSFKAGLYEKGKPAGDHVVIGLIDLPHISNFTDVEPFLTEPDLHLQIIRTVDDLNEVGSDLAALILPGSKNVISDLNYLRESGLAARIIELAAGTGLDIIGICGGFQMLGARIADPLGIESSGEVVEALGILEMTTTLAEEKTLTRRTAIHLPSRLKVHGYEIHHGRTVSNHARALRLDDGSEAGAVSKDGRIWGSYLHGIFDDDDFRRWFIDMLRSSRNLQPLGGVVAPYDLEAAFDRLAGIVRESLDMDRIYRLLDLK
ncbi:MAG: cobyric acid synthase [Desulfurivibrionaceae bacterium]